MSWSALWWMFWDPWPSAVVLGVLGETDAFPFGNARTAEAQASRREALQVSGRRTVEPA